jgi:hypothetical protein
MSAMHADYTCKIQHQAHMFKRLCTCLVLVLAQTRLHSLDDLDRAVLGQQLHIEWA